MPEQMDENPNEDEWEGTIKALSRIIKKNG